MFAPSKPKGIPLFRIGFRPLFLAGTLFSFFAMLFWVWSLMGKVLVYPMRIDPVSWHKHELLFGFGGAILGGFLLTSVSNWTGRETFRRAKLFLVSLVWTFGRVLMFVSASISPKIVAMVDCLYFPLIFWGIAPAIYGSKNKNNYFVPVFITVLFVANLGWHLSWLSADILLAERFYDLGFFLFCAFLSIFGTRIIPLFSVHAVPGILVSRNKKAESIANLLVGIWVICEIFHLPANFLAILSFLTGSVNLFRFSYWKPYKTFAHPMVLILHLGYAALCLGFFSAGFYHLNLISSSLFRHTFMVGAFSVLIMGMIPRVSLGHTGRFILPSPLIYLIFISVFLSFLCRVVFVFVFPALELHWIYMAGIFWAFSMFFYLLRFAPVLLTSRPDGRDG